jgi:hypothetical protein
VEHRLSPGAIVALHDGTGLGGGRDREATLEALSSILTECEHRGLSCVALSEVEVGGEVARDIGSRVPPPRLPQAKDSRGRAIDPSPPVTAGGDWHGTQAEIAIEIASEVATGAR